MKSARVELKVTGTVTFEEPTADTQEGLFEKKDNEPITEKQAYFLEKRFGFKSPFDVSKFSKQIAQSLIGNIVVFEKQEQARRDAKVTVPEEVHETLNDMTPMPWDEPEAVKPTVNNSTTYPTVNKRGRKAKK